MARPASGTEFTAAPGSTLYIWKVKNTNILMVEPNSGVRFQVSFHELRSVPPGFHINLYELFDPSI